MYIHIKVRHFAVIRRANVHYTVADFIAEKSRCVSRPPDAISITSAAALACILEKCTSYVRQTIKAKEREKEGE